MASIIFGWYTIKIKSYTAHELGIEGELPDFQVRQRIFQLFYIPVFPIGKVYVFKEDGKIYKAPESVKQLIKERKDYRTPWYSFLLPILAAVLLISGVSYNFHKDWSDRKNAEESFYQQAENIDRNLAELILGNYVGLARNHSNYQVSHYLKVLKSEGGQVQVVKSEDGACSGEPHEILKYFQQNKDRLKVITLSLEQLQKANCKNYKSYWEGDDLCGEDLFSTGEKFIIHYIGYFDGPDFSIFSYTSFNSDGITSLSIKNTGLPSQLIELKETSNNVKWESDRIGTTIETGEYLKMNGTCGKSCDYTFVISLKDTTDKIHRFTISQSGEKDPVIKRNI